MRLKQLGIRLIIWLLHALKGLFQFSVSAIVVILTPFGIILSFLLQPIILFLYKQYLRVLTSLRHSAFMQNKVLFLFSNKYFIHLLVGVLTVFVASANVIQAKTLFSSDFGTQSALYKIVSENGDQLQVNTTIVETGVPLAKLHTSYVPTAGLMVANIPNVNPKADAPQSIGDQLKFTAGQAVASSNSLLNTSVGIRSSITEYKVQDGDTISEIADRFGVTVNTILLANNLTSSSYIRPGNTLKILPASGISYTIASGDTLSGIVKKYSGDLDKTVEVNDIGADGIVAVGKEIVIVGGTPPPPPAPVHTSYFSQIASSGSVSHSVGSAVTGGRLNWPVGCHAAMTTYWGHPHNARDLPCPYGTPIYAAESGTVKIMSSGCPDYNKYCGGGYGNYLDIYSANGLVTRYAHQKPNSFTVVNGQYVTRGQNIGFVGMTGRTSGPHLHFEIAIGGVFYDPINFLRY